MEPEAMNEPILDTRRMVKVLAPGFSLGVLSGWSLEAGSW
jgi:hypothetical protein